MCYSLGVIACLFHILIFTLYSWILSSSVGDDCIRVVRMSHNAECPCSREFSHRIKSISMAKFTPGEVANLQSGGNGVLCFTLKRVVGCLLYFSCHGLQFRC